MIPFSKCNPDPLGNILGFQWEGFQGDKFSPLFIQTGSTASQRDTWLLEGLRRDLIPPVMMLRKAGLKKAPQQLILLDVDLRDRMEVRSAIKQEMLEEM
ncbi:MAG: hypothetical protein P8L18_08295 [Verrucomicrobiota bacterium]|nr:hypothetical protein [Verrucomicrobiota bacterium]